MRQTPTDKIVEFLNFSREATWATDHFGEITDSKWLKLLQWMDDAGLALYFLQKLQDKEVTHTVPEWVITRLRKSFADNTRRVADLSRRFAFLNQTFNRAGVRYAVLKGLSLVPQFCPKAQVRSQSDFDYLVDEHTLGKAKQSLITAGYSPKHSPSKEEFIFVLPHTNSSHPGNQYDPKAPHAVELHLDMWDSNHHQIDLPRGLLSVERARIQQWNGMTFPSLTEEDAFLLQILHACHHLFTHWIRVSSLLEIGYFLNHSTSDAALWTRIERRVGNNRRLREFVVLVCELVSRIFNPPLPPLIGRWGPELNAASRVWIEHYSRRWALCELPVYRFGLFPESKLVLFLHEQYRRREAKAGHAGEHGPPPPSRLVRMASAMRKEPMTVFNPKWWSSQLLFRRSLFHLLSGIRYAYEIPRWRWRNRAVKRTDTTCANAKRFGSSEEHLVA